MARQCLAKKKENGSFFGLSMKDFPEEEAFTDSQLRVISTQNLKFLALLFLEKARNIVTALTSALSCNKSNILSNLCHC